MGPPAPHEEMSDDLTDTGPAEPADAGEPVASPDPAQAPAPAEEHPGAAAGTDTGDTRPGAGDGPRVEAEPTRAEAGPASAAASPTGPGRWRRFGRVRGLRRATQASLLIGMLFALLGFGLAVQVRTNSSTSGLATARQEDLVRILDDLSSREDRLRQQIASLQAARRTLTTSGDKVSAALGEARDRSAALGILAGTAPAQGPGVVLTLNDPGHRLDAEDLLDAVEELRAAGAEAFQVGSVRIGPSTAFTGDRGGILVDGTPVAPPYLVVAIGDPGTLATALNIPGGVVASVRNAGGEAVVAQRQHVVINAVRTLTTPRYASPAPDKHGD